MIFMIVYVFKLPSFHVEDFFVFTIQTLGS
jgi:hypothetical protein